jgi:hypothetical protein
MSNRNVVSVRGKRKIVLAAGSESMGSKGKRGILFSGLVVVVAFFMVWAGAAIGSMISPPNQIVLQNQSIAQYVYTNNSSAIPFADVNGQIEYPMPAGQHVSYIETNATLAELNSRDAGKISLNLSQPGSSPSLSYAPSLIHTDLLGGGSIYVINFTETGLPAGTKWGVTAIFMGAGGPRDSFVTNKTYILVKSAPYPLPFEVFPQSADPSTPIIYASGSLYPSVTNVSVVFHAPQPSYYIYTLSHKGTATISKLKANSFFNGNRTATNTSLTNVSTVNVGSNPVAMQTSGDYTYVANYNSSNISVIKGAKLAGTVSLPSGSEPNAIDIFNGTVYVTGNGTNSLYLIGLTNMSLYRTIAFTNGINPVAVNVQSALASHTFSGKNQTMAFVAIANGTGNGTMAVVIFTGSSYTVSYFTLYAKSPTSMVCSPYSGYRYGTPVGTAFEFLVAVPNTVESFQFNVTASPAAKQITYENQTTGIPDFKIIGQPILTGYEGYAIALANQTQLVAYMLSGSNSNGLAGGRTVSMASYSDTVSLPNGLDIFSQKNGLNISSQMVVSMPSGVPNYQFMPWDPVAVSYSTIENYSITVNEKGLPANVNWTATVNNVTQASNTTSMTFYASNGTYSYSAKFVNYSGSNGIMGYIPFFNGSGTLTVNGSSISKTIGYEPGYGVTFIPKNLTAGTSWTLSVTTNTTVNVSSKIVSSVNTTHVTTTAANLILPFLNSTISASQEINGTLTNVTYTMKYSYSISSPNYLASESAFNFSVDQSGLTENTIALTEVAFGVTFTETGLPANTSWSISLNGAARNSSTSSILFSEPNGTYDYAIGGVTGYTTSSAGGSVTVNGSSAQVNITFSPLVVMPTEITIGYGTSPANFVPLAYATVNGSSVSFTIQPQYLTGNQSKYLMIRISSSSTTIDLRATIYGNSGISTYFGPITGEEIGYWLGAVMIFGGAFMAMPWHDFRFRRGVKR